MSSDDLRARLEALLGPEDAVAPPSAPPPQFCEWLSDNLTRDADGNYELSPRDEHGTALGALEELLREDDEIAAWIGEDLAMHLGREDATLVFRDGFVREAFIGNHQSDLDAAAVIESLAATPAASGIERLTIYGALDEVPALLARGGAPATLRTLQLVGSLGEIASSLGDVELQNLEALEIRTDFTPEMLAFVGRLRAPRLASLVLLFGSRVDDFGEPYESEDDDDEDEEEVVGYAADDFARVFDIDAPELRHLALVGLSSADEIVAHLTRSTLASRLTRLDLRSGSLTDEGARTLAESLAPNGRCNLDVDACLLSPQGVALLRGKFSVVTADGQRLD